MQKLESVTLESLAGGAIPEIFQRELAKVLKNVADMNTSVKTKRKITIGIEFKPHKDRAGAEVSVSCKCQLAAVEAVESSVFVGSVDGELQAYGRDPRQALLFAQEPAPASPPVKTIGLVH